MAEVSLPGVAQPALPCRPGTGSVSCRAPPCAGQCSAASGACRGYPQHPSAISQPHGLLAPTPCPSPSASSTDWRCLPDFGIRAGRCALQMWCDPLEPPCRSPAALPVFQRHLHNQLGLPEELGTTCPWQCSQPCVCCGSWGELHHCPHSPVSRGAQHRACHPALGTRDCLCVTVQRGMRALEQQYHPGHPQKVTQEPACG